MRFLQFRLRTLLIAVTVLAVPLAWVSYSLNWIRARRNLLNDRVVVDITDSWSFTDAPAGLGLFGEQGWRVLVYQGDSSRTIEDARRLFPEAQVVGLSRAELTR